MENNTQVWLLEKGRSFLNNRRLPDFQNIAYILLEFEKKNSIEEKVLYLNPILRNYQSALMCANCYNDSEDETLLELTMAIINMISSVIGSSNILIDWQNLKGDMLAFANEFKDISCKKSGTFERRKKTVEASIDLLVKKYPKTKGQVHAHAFFSDFNRISSSSAFRRLQDKAQVFPLEKYDYARTRLTHTIEVTSIAMQLGNLCAQQLRNGDNRSKKEFSFLFEKCLVCAALLHDLGNPPFGHFGEDSIKEYFRINWAKLTVNLHYPNRDQFTQCKIDDLDTGTLTDIESSQIKSDFTFFDGNAQSLRVASKTQQYKIDTPLNLTAAVLGSIIKYPCNSLQGSVHEKFGYFFSERDIIDKLNCMETFQEHLRNPLAMLLEAADDISYVTSDLDDAVKKRAITREEFESEMEKFEDTTDDASVKVFCDNYRKYYMENKVKTQNPFEYTIQRMTNDLRIQLIGEVVSEFVKQSDSILQKGIYYLDEEDFQKECEKSGNNVPITWSWLNKGHTHGHNEILDCVPSSILIGWIKKRIFVKHIYCHTDILKNELAGFQVVTYLLSQFTEAVLSLDFNPDNEGDFLLCNRKKYGKQFFRQEKIFELISKNFVSLFKSETKGLAVNSLEHVYYRLRLVVDYISGMTDCYALEIYRVLQGI